MKLMLEQAEDVQVIEEDAGNGKKNLYIEGIFMQAETKNRNGRLYPKQILAKESSRYIKENIDKHRAFGELGHPANPTINLDRASHMIVSLREDGNNFIGKAKIMDTPHGKIVKELMREGASLGVSSRGVGSLKNNGTLNEVQKDFRLITPADIVADPSAPDAFVQGVMENAEWIFDAANNVWIQRFVDGAKEQIDEAVRRRELEQKKWAIFEQFMAQL